MDRNGLHTELGRAADRLFHTIILEATGNDSGVAKRIKPRQRVGSNLRRVQLDRGSAASPIVVDGVRPAAPHIADSFHGECHSHLRVVAFLATADREMENANARVPDTISMLIVLAAEASSGSQVGMLIAFLLAAAAPDCTYDRAAMMALPQQAFDQDTTGGWRALSMRGCEAEAADLIRDWRETNKPERNASILYWHEGQLRADLGQSAAAITLFERSRKTVEEDHGMGWNLYVDGSIAFLRRDRAAFDQSRAALAALPKPDGFDPRGPDGKPIEIRWPMNLNVLDGFARCWDKPYKEAYTICSAPFRVMKAGG